MGAVNAIFRAANPLGHATAVFDASALLLRLWRLAVAMGKRELTTRYAGQLAGGLWILAHPLLQMLIFVFLFSVVFNQRMGGTYELPRDYTVYILSGLVAWLSILPVLTTTCHSVIANSSLVKQFSFETEVLPLKDVYIAMIFWFVGVSIVAAYTIFAERSLPWTYALAPALFAVHLLTMVGIAWALSSITVFVRDVKDIAIVLSTAGVYLLPVVYLPQWIPPLFRPFIYLNPLSYLIWMYQDVFYYGRIEHPIAWVVAPAFGIVVFSCGHRLFQRLKPFFGNVL